MPFLLLQPTGRTVRVRRRVRDSCTEPLKPPAEQHAYYAVLQPKPPLSKQVRYRWEPRPGGRVAIGDVATATPRKLRMMPTHISPNQTPSRPASNLPETHAVSHMSRTSLAWTFSFPPFFVLIFFTADRGLAPLRTKLNLRVRANRVYYIYRHFALSCPYSCLPSFPSLLLIRSGTWDRDALRISYTSTRRRHSLPPPPPGAH